MGSGSSTSPNMNTASTDPLMERKRAAQKALRAILKEEKQSKKPK